MPQILLFPYAAQKNVFIRKFFKKYTLFTNGNDVNTYQYNTYVLKYQLYITWT